MKKEYKFKIGDRVRVLDTCQHQNKLGVYNGAPPSYIYSRYSYNIEFGDGSRCYAEKIRLVKSPKKVTKPHTKRVKPQESYLTIHFTKRENGYELSAWKATGESKQFVFNTKARMLKWIERSI